jgi:hypothetical protein
MGWTVTLSDPGMYDRKLAITSWEGLGPLLEQHGRSYTRAAIAVGPRVVGWAIRDVGEKDWVVRRRVSPLSAP